MIGNQEQSDPAIEYTRSKMGGGDMTEEDQVQLDLLRGTPRAKTRVERESDTIRDQRQSEYVATKRPTIRRGKGVTPPRAGGVTRDLRKIIIPNRLIAPAPPPSSSRLAVTRVGGFLPLLPLLASVAAPLISRIFGDGRKHRAPPKAAMRRYMKTFSESIRNAEPSGSGKHDAEYWETLRETVADAMRDVIVQIFAKDPIEDDELERLANQSVAQILPEGFIKHAPRFYGMHVDEKGGRGTISRMLGRHEFIKPWLHWEAHKLLKRDFQGPERTDLLNRVSDAIWRLPAKHELFVAPKGTGLFDLIKKGISWVGSKLLPNLLPAVTQTVSEDKAARQAAEARAQEIEERRARAEERRREEDLDRAARRRRQMEDDEYYMARRARDLPPPTREKRPAPVYDEEEDEEPEPPKPAKKPPAKSKAKAPAVEASGRRLKKK